MTFLLWINILFIHDFYQHSFSFKKINYNVAVKHKIDKILNKHLQKQELYKYNLNQRKSPYMYVHRQQS